MLFNSFEFALLLILVFAFYWMAKRREIRNGIILIASYTFYGFWDWRFLTLIVFSSLVDFFIGKLIAKQDKRIYKRFLLAASLIANLGILGFFKYFNFFANSFVRFSSDLGFQVHPTTLNIILPVGISFYTFQTLSYTIDIYRGRLKPTKGLLSFFTFVSFFPQLVAGPIERAAHLLPQFQKNRIFDRKLAEDGLKQMLWGFFKKIIIADNAAIIVNDIFTDYSNASSFALLIGLFLFSFQIYADFSGYSDIAIGVAKLFGINLMTNFRMPYFSASIGEFWRRWHISLSTWFRDYVYIPLGGSKNGVAKQALAIFATFLLSGLWHGANMNFIVWGFIHALLYSFELLFSKISFGGNYLNSFFAKLVKPLRIVFVFFMVMLAWLFFRAENISDAFVYLKTIFRSNESPEISILTLKSQMPFLVAITSILLLLIMEWLSKDKQHPFQNLKQAPVLQYIIFLLFILILFLFAPGEKSDFIYFQF